MADQFQSTVGVGDFSATYDGLGNLLGMAVRYRVSVTNLATGASTVNFTGPFDVDPAAFTRLLASIPTPNPDGTPSVAFSPPQPLE